MKKRLFTLLGLVVIFSLALNAQVTLPYYTGFDNGAQQSGWTEYKKAATTFSHWGYWGGGYSLPNCVGHDYSPSTGITLTDNWFVSPSFSISSGGKLDSIRYMFSGFSTPLTGDTIAIYLLNGSPDPALATSKQLLFDFRGADYNTDGVYRIKTNIVLPSKSGFSYLAIRYRNTDCSSKWLTVNFDNVAISGNASGINEPGILTEKVNVYPNPANGVLTINTGSGTQKSLELFNMAGQVVYTSSMNENMTMVISGLPKGVYILKLTSAKEILERKFVKE